MNKYELGYEDEFIGIYYGNTEEEALASYREDKVNASLRGIEVELDTPVRERIGSKMIIRKVEY